MNEFLRKVDSSTKIGTILTDAFELDYELMTNVDQRGKYAVRGISSGNIYMSNEVPLWVKPLFYVANKPVYPGDQLYYNSVLVSVERSDSINDTVLCKVIGNDRGMILNTTDLYWDKPNTKTSGWINLYKESGKIGPGVVIYPDKATAVSCVHVRDLTFGYVDTIQINWEE